MTESTNTTRTRLLHTEHSSISRLLLTVGVAIGVGGLLLPALPKGIAIIILLVIFGLILVDTAVRRVFAGKPFWQVARMFTEPLDYHTWRPVSGGEASLIAEEFGVRSVESVARCSDCNAIQLHATSARGDQLVAHAGGYLGDGLRVGLFLRIAKLTPMRSGAGAESEPVGTNG